MNLKRTLWAALLAGLCCLGLAACAPNPSQSSGSGDPAASTLLPNGWDAADFTVQLFDKYGLSDNASPMTLTNDEQEELLGLLGSSDWEIIDPDTLPPHDPCFFVYLQAADGRTLGVGALINSDQSMLMLQDEEAYLLYSGSPKAVEQSQALLEAVIARRNSLLPSGEAEILYPDLLPEAVTSTGAYRIAAADPTAVIIWNGRVATGRTAADSFWQAAESGGTGELSLYTFSPNHAEPDKIQCQYDRFWTDGGSSWYFSDYSADSSTAFMEPSRYDAQLLEVNDYGYLVASGDFVSEPTGYLVIPDRLLWEDADQRVQLYERYLEPVLPSALGETEWDSLEEIPQPLWVFEDLYHYDHQNASPFDVYGADWPVDEMAAQLSRYFDGVTEEQLIALYQEVYDPATGTLHYEGGRGGGPFCLRVTGWEEDGDQLTLNYEEYSSLTGEPYEDREYQLTVQLMEDGSFRYLSNHRA